MGLFNWLYMVIGTESTAGDICDYRSEAKTDAGWKIEILEILMAYDTITLGLTIVCHCDVVVGGVGPVS